MSFRVLLATHNGSAFLDEQLQSLELQSGVDLSVLALDDASSDSSVEILRAHDAISVDLIQSDQPLGLPGAFLSLLQLAGSDHEFYAYCDQDDVWEPHKLSAAQEALRQHPPDVPALWICGHERINAYGAPLGHIAPSRSDRVLGHALVESIGPGCAMVWNRALQLSMRIPPAEEVMMHDSWTYATAAAIGTVIVDERPLIRYRIHGGNAIGVNRSHVARLRRYLQSRTGNQGTLERQARSLLRYYSGLLTADQVQLVQAVADRQRLRRLRLVRSGQLHRSDSLETGLLALRMLLP